ncbi:MAG TPA: ATP-binding protein [Gaiellaceae bacterium]|nr:ATP-binding protein [Gaiellaceae bacterium]
MPQRCDDLTGLLEESAEELYEQAPVAYASSLPDGRIVKANETLLRWTGRGRRELLERCRLHDLLAPGARIYYETHYAPLLQMQGEVREIAVELVRPDGGRLPVLMSSVLVRDEEGRGRLVRSTFFDASERRRYERELLRARADAESRARAALALGHVEDGVVLVGPTGRVEVLNPAAERIFGVAADSALDRAADEAIPGWSAVAAAGAGEVVPVERDGHEQWLDVAATEAGDAVVYTIRDVTADRRLERMRTDLVAIVSHELRTPLTGVYGAATTLLARDAELGADGRRTMLELLVEQARRLATIVDQILLTSRLETGNAEVGAEVFDLADVFVDLGRAATGETHRLIVDVEPGIRVRGDLDRLRQVVTNLADNALKYSGGPVRCAVETRELAARITISDEGPGIPPGEQERIFEKFYRLDPAQSSGVGGTGLGLYIARELVERMDGRVGLLRRDGGATFYVDVPLA